MTKLLAVNYAVYAEKIYFLPKGCEEGEMKAV
jgi:hypothetical protein